MKPRDGDQSLQRLNLHKALLEMAFFEPLWCACIFSASHPQLFNPFHLQPFQRWKFDEMVPHEKKKHTIYTVRGVVPWLHGRRVDGASGYLFVDR